MDDTRVRPGVIRRAGAADAEALHGLVRMPIVALHGGGTSEAGRDAESAALELRDPCIDTLVAEAAEGLQGFLQLRWGVRPPSASWMQGSVELRRHHVRVRHRGTGVAQRLLEAAIEIARARQAVCIWLKVDKSAPEANGFYRKHGFRVAGTALFTEGGACREHWVMHRVLAYRKADQAHSLAPMLPSGRTISGWVSAPASRRRA